MIRRDVLVSMVLAMAVAGAYGQTAGDGGGSGAGSVGAPGSPLNSRIIKAGVSQDENADWELQARSQAAEQEEAQTGSFMGNPLVFRVTSVGEVNKSNGMQKITAMPIHSVTISADGTVDLGQIVEGSGDGMEVPPGTLQKGDLFTRIQNQYVKIPANHFDAMGSLADQVNKQVPADSPSALNKLANQLANAADDYGNNAANFGNDFLKAATNTIGQTLNFLAQPRGDFGQPGKPLQDIWKYLNNDYNENDAKLHAAAEQAAQQIATHPGTFLGNNVLLFAPMGQLGKAEEVAEVSQAAQRLTAMENAASDFSKMERGLPQYPSVPGKAALEHAQYPPGGPPPEPYLGGRVTPAPKPAGVPPGEVSASGGVDQTAPPGAGGAVPPPVMTGGGDTVPTPGLPDAPTVRTPGAAGEPPPRTAGGGGPGGVPGVGSNPNSPLQSRNIPSGSNAPPRSGAPGSSGRPAGASPRSTPAAPAKPGPLTAAERQAIKDSMRRLSAALDRDAQWAGNAPQRSPLAQDPPTTPTVPSGGGGNVSPPAAPATPVNGAAPSVAPEPDIVSTLESRFGSDPKDPLQGAPGLAESRFGIPTPATTASITHALLLAGRNSQGLVFSQNPDKSLGVLNARNNEGKVEFADPATERRAQPPADSPLYFYRTK